MSSSETDYTRDRSDELQETISFDGYQIARREEFSRRKKSAEAIRKDSSTSDAGRNRCTDIV